MNESFDSPTTSPFPWKRWLLLSLIVAMVCAVVGFGARPAYRKFKQWRSGRLAEVSSRLLNENKVAEAREKAQAALLLWPRNGDALRAMAQALTRETNAAALQFWAQLIQTGQADLQDRHTFVEQALRAGATEAAGREVQRLLKEAPDSAENLWLASQWFTLIRNRGQALEYASLAALRNPTNRQYKLFISSLQFDAPEEIQRSAARSNVWARAREADALGLDALVFLAQREGLTAAERLELIQLLQKHPARSVTHELTALRLRLEAEPQRRNEILDQAVEHYLKAEPEPRVAFTVWLNQNDESDRVLLAMPLDEAIKRKDFFLPRLDALAALNRWAELKKLLETKQSPLERTYVEGFLARCNAELKQPEFATLHWRAALKAAERNPEQLLWLARYAEKCDQVDLATKALRDLITCVGNPLPAFLELEQLTARTGTTEEVRNVLDEMARRWPNDRGIQNSLAYFNLLLGRELAASWRVAQQLVAAAPESLPFRTTLALALHQQRDYQTALKTYDGLDYPWAQAAPNQRAVLATVLAANGRSSEARQLAASIPRSALRPEERSLISHLQP